MRHSPGQSWMLFALREAGGLELDAAQIIKVADHPVMQLGRHEVQCAQLRRIQRDEFRQEGAA